MFGERGYHDRRILAGDLEKHHEAGVTLDARRNVRGVLFDPEKRSLSQWPGTARSSASAGRSRMEPRRALTDVFHYCRSYFATNRRFVTLPSS
jgi:hypothetical protein